MKKIILILAVIILVGICNTLLPNIPCCPETIPGTQYSYSEEELDPNYMDPNYKQVNYKPVFTNF